MRIYEERSPNYILKFVVLKLVEGFASLRAGCVLIYGEISSILGINMLSNHK